MGAHLGPRHLAIVACVACVVVLACAQSQPSPAPSPAQPSGLVPAGSGALSSPASVELPADFPAPPEAQLVVLYASGSGPTGSVAATWVSGKVVSDVQAFYDDGSFPNWSFEVASSTPISAVASVRDAGARFAVGVLALQSRGRTTSVTLYLGPVFDAPLTAPRELARPPAERSTTLPAGLAAALVPADARVMDAVEVPGTGRLVAWLEVPLAADAAVAFYRSAFATLDGAPPLVETTGTLTLLTSARGERTFVLVEDRESVIVRISVAP